MFSYRFAFKLLIISKYQEFQKRTDSITQQHNTEKGINALCISRFAILWQKIFRQIFQFMVSIQSSNCICIASYRYSI